MTFREIIEAALKEHGASFGPHEPYHNLWQDIYWKNNEDLSIYFYGISSNRRCEISGRRSDTLYYHYLLDFCATDLLNPNWSPKMLAKQIDDEIVKKI